MLYKIDTLPLVSKALSIVHIPQVLIIQLLYQTVVTMAQ